MINATRITASALGVYAALLGIEHGYFETLQGEITPGGLMINAIGVPCQPDAIWHACLPALTLIPNMFVTGVVAILVGLTMLIWSVAFVGRKYGGLILILLSILLLFVGGGFIPMFIGVLAGFTGTRINTPPKWMWAGSRNFTRFLARLWPWTLILLMLWFPASWVVGYYFSQLLLDLSIFLFLIFDIGLPIMASLSAIAYDAHELTESQFRIGSK